MRVASLVGVLILSVISGSQPTYAQGSNVLIVELQSNSLNSSSEEFIELYNPSDELIDMTGWRIEYAAASDTAKWSKKAVLVGNIPAKGRYLVTSKDYLASIADATFASGLSDQSGSVRLVSVDGETQVEATSDLVGWGSAFYNEDEATSAHKKGESLKRRVDEEGRFVDTDSNKNDFITSNNPTPTSDDQDNLDEQDEPEETDIDQSPVDEVIPDETLEEFEIWITELLPDPVSPYSDTDDEFIELFNPTDTTVNLEGYTLQTGLTYNYKYVLPTMQLAPGQYVSLPSKQTNLALSNSGGRARIVAPSGKIVFETPEYEKAKAGQAYIRLSDGTWAWSEAVTPSTENALVATQTTSSASQSKSTTKKLKTAATKAKPKAKKAAAKKATKPKAKTANASTAKLPQEQDKVRLDNNWLVALGSAALLYGAYEYRDDIRNRYQKLRRYSKSRK